jgi:hypothetical protein
VVQCKALRTLDEEVHRFSNGDQQQKAGVLFLLFFLRKKRTTWRTPCKQVPRITERFSSTVGGFCKGNN